MSTKATISGRALLARLIVSGGLAAFAVGTYLLIVVALGSLLEVDAGSAAWLEIGATVLISVRFEAIRRRLGRFADRLVYGRRADPYEVLAEFSRTVAVSHPVPLDQVVRSLAEGTTAASASAWVLADGALVRSAAWPDDATAPPSVQVPVAVTTGRDPEGPALPACDLTRPVIHEGELLGAVALTASHGRALLSSDARLLEQVSSGLGLAMHNERLRDDLQRRIDELQRSRRRIVAIQVEARRRLERDLHDGVQQRLIAIRLRLGMARRRVASRSLGVLLDGLAGDADRAIDALREFAHGLYPPALEADGLEVALASWLRRRPFAVALDARAIGRHPRDVEAAMYFCVSESLRALGSGDPPGPARVSLRQADGALTFEVTTASAGPGARPPGGDRLARIAERIAALGGRLDVDDSPATGITIRGTVPSSPIGDRP